jgi:hypothetical protein
MQINERQVVLSAYGDAIVNAVKTTEDEEPAVSGKLQ